LVEQERGIEPPNRPLEPKATLLTGLGRLPGKPTAIKKRKASKTLRAKRAT